MGGVLLRVGIVPSVARGNLLGIPLHRIDNPAANGGIDNK
jgi:hypothetical protein